MGRQSGGEVQRRRSGTASGNGVGVQAAMTGRRREEAEAPGGLSGRRVEEAVWGGDEEAPAETGGAGR